MKEVMAIFDTDAGFAENLAENLRNQVDFPYHVQGFGTREKLIRELSSGAVSLLVADRKDIDPELREMLGNRTGSGTALVPYGSPQDIMLIYLTEVRGYAEISGHPAVYKYQPVSRLSMEILSAAKDAEKRGRILRESVSGAWIIGVAGPVGRCGKTSFCLTLGQLIAAEKSTLYMNFDPCSALPDLLGEDNDKDLSDLLYAFSADDAGTDFSAFIRNFHGLDIICPVRLQEDLYRTDPEKFVFLTRELVRSRGYHAVILDLGCGLRLTEAFLPLISKLFIPTRKDAVSGGKAVRFRDWLFRIREDAGALDPEEITLPLAHPFVSGKNYLGQLLWSELGDYARSLYERER